MVELLDLLNSVNSKFGEGFKIKSVTSDDLVFEENVLLSCFYCGKYGTNWKCPPHLPKLDYKKALGEYDNMAFLWIDMPYDDSTYADVRSESSIRLHKALLHLEKYLWAEGHSSAISFIGGSCKLCRNGCGLEKCNNPYMSRSPLEATGMNVVKSAANCGIRIVFPPQGSIMRLGLIAW